MSLTPETLVTDAELAALVGVSSRRIRQLAEAGTLERTERGRYALGPAIRAMMDQASGSGSELQKERIRKLRADANLAELHYAQELRQVAPIEEFQRAWELQCTVIRQNVLNVPGRAVLQLLGETDESIFKQKLRAELVLALETAAEAKIELGDIDEE